MSSLNPNISGLRRAAVETLHAHRRLFTLQAVLMIILGMLAVAVPAVATIAVDVYFGCLFLISGIFGLVAMFSAKDVPAFLWTLGTALLSVVTGALLIWNPAEGAVSLTIVLTAFFIVEGLIQTAASIGYRDMIPNSWGWMLASGLSDLALAVIIIWAWPVSVTWVLGLLVGINLITSGAAIASTAIASRYVTA
jgi:uncharacterized membrane protein HdeD (DUF308 family)